MTLSGVKQPSIDAAFDSHYKKIREGDLAYQRRLATAYRAATDEIMRESARLATYVEQQMDAGAPVSPSWLSRQTRYISLQSQLDAAMREFGEATGSILEEQRAASARAGLSGLREEVLSAVGGNTAGLPDLSVDSWGRIDRKAFEASMSTLIQNRSPLKGLIEGISSSALVVFQDEWAKGLVLGRNPKKIARGLASKIQALSQGRAQLIARTEWHRGVREARSKAFTESKVITKWIWRAALDGRTCGICYLMHGTEHLTSERLPGHPACRCVMIPKTVDWKDLGVPDIKNTRPPIEPGEAAFGRLPEATQRRLIGKARLEQFKNGSKLSDMVHIQPNAKWGSVAKFKPGSAPAPRAMSPAETLASHEDRIRGLVDHEEAVVLDADGHVVIDKAGNTTNSRQVMFTPEELAKMQGGVLTHNHPGVNQQPGEYTHAASLSPDDVALFFKGKLGEIRATGTGAEYSLKGSGIDGGWDRVKPIYQGHDADVRREFTQKIANGEMTMPEANSNHGHEVLRRTVADLADYGYDITYTRTLLP